jgi:hypothetical protein
MMTKDQRVALALVVSIFAIPIVLIAINRSRVGAGYGVRPHSLAPIGNSRARIVYEPVIMENEESWEIQTDPVTGIPLKVIGHRRVSYGGN